MTPETEAPLSRRAWLAVRTWWPNVFVFGGALVLAASGALSTAPLAGVVAAIASIAGQWKLWLRARVDADLRARLASAEQARDAALVDLRHAIDAELEHIGTQLDFLSDERISLFIPEGAGLRLIARHSGSRSHGLGKAHRDLYREDEGCLGRAWNTGEVFVTDLPDPQNNLGLWIEQQLQLGVRAPNELTMRTRTYYLKRLQLEGGPHVGVIVLESESTPNRYAELRAYRSPKITAEKMRTAVRDEMKPLCALATGARLLGQYAR